MPRAHASNDRLRLFTLAVLAYITFQSRQKSSLSERNLLAVVGNPGFSPAAAAVMQLYREGKLFGETSILRGKNIMGANWQRVVLPKSNLDGMNFTYADLRDTNFEESSLIKANFYWAKLTHANLIRTNLERADLTRSDLQHANLVSVNAVGASLFMARAQRAVMAYIDLKHADLQEADLHGADLSAAILTQAHLRDTNFARANLERANLGWAFMVNANLTDANLKGAYFSEHTVLPDAKWLHFDADGKSVFDKYWTSQTDMSRYTDPTHWDFWQPAWAAKYEWVKKNYAED